MKNLFVAITFLASFAASANPMPPPPESLSALDGTWHSERYKMDITVKNGVATVSKMDSTHASPKHQRFAVGVVLARFTSSKPDAIYMRYFGECRESMGNDYIMRPCNQFSASSRMNRDPKGKSWMSLNIGTEQFFPPAQMKGKLNSRI